MRMVRAQSGGWRRRPDLMHRARRPVFSLFVGVLAVFALVFSGLGHGAAAGPMAMTICDRSAVEASAAAGDQTGACSLSAAATAGEANAGQVLPATDPCPQHAPCVHVLIAPERPLLEAQGSNRVIAAISDPLRERTEGPPLHPPIS